MTMIHTLPFASTAEDLDALVPEIIQEVEVILGRNAGALAPEPLPSSRASEIERLSDEIVIVGRKLWERHYVDGCGGNISVRIGSDRVLCTPTMMSKADITPADLCITDLAGNLLKGSRSRTSELLLHLAIYKANPHARAVVHCHPPHATAYAITGVEPPPSYLVEQELFVGPVPIAPYETPGTAAFAETVLPFVSKHNSILLANHGIVCWADTATHAEWLVEIVDTYCRTLLLAAQVTGSVTPISRQKLQELSLKQKASFSSLCFDPEATSEPSCGTTSTGINDVVVKREDLERIVRIALSVLQKKGSLAHS